MGCVNLNTRTLQLLRDRPRTVTYRTIQEALRDSPHLTEPVSLNWLTLYGTERITSPDVNRVQAIYEFLTKLPLIG